MLGATASVFNQEVPHIAVVGAGAIGCALLPLLGKLCAAQVTIIDGDTVELGNLPRQLLFTPDDIGRPKVHVAVERMRAGSQASHWQPEFRFIDRANAEELLLGCAFVVDCTDDLPARRLIQHACARLAIPVVSGAVHGKQVQVSTQAGTRAAEGSFFSGRPSEEQEGCDMQAVPLAVVTLAAALMALRIEDLLKGGHGLADHMDLVDAGTGRWMRIKGPRAGTLVETPLSPEHSA